MMERITPTELRANIYKIIDRVIATGEPCEIVRGGHRLTLAPVRAAKKRPRKAASKKAVSQKGASPNEGLITRLSKLPKRKVWLGTEEELLNFKVWDEKAWERKWDKLLKE